MQPHDNLGVPSPRNNQPGQAPPSEPGQQPQMVYLSRPLTPEQPHISEEARRRHERSKQLYPELNLSEGEFVINAIRRHPIGLIEIWAVVVLMVLLTLTVVPLFAANQSSINQILSASGTLGLSTLAIALPLLLICGLFIGGGIIATIVYQGNKFFLTNESVVQIIRVSLFSSKEQTISLANIEDASFRRHGILQAVLNYGSLRLSTEGDETTYRFNYVTKPKEQVATLNNAVEAFKNGRPVDIDEKP